MKPTDLLVGACYSFERRERPMNPERAKVLAVMGDDVEVEIDAPQYDIERGEWRPGLAPACRGTVPARCLHGTWTEWVAERAARTTSNARTRAAYSADRAAASAAVEACGRLGIIARVDAYSNEVRVTSTEKLAAALLEVANQKGQ